MAAVALISVLVIREVEKLPDVSVCTTPALFNPSTDNTPAADIFIRSTPAVLIDRLSFVVERPVVGLPVKFSDGAEVVPAGSVNVPVILSPALAILLFSCVCTEEVVPDKKPNSVAVTLLEVS